MQELKRIQRDYEANKSIEILFRLDFDGFKTSITNLQINGNFESGLPSSPTLEIHDNKFVLFTHYYVEENGKSLLRHTPILNNEYADDIVSEIIRIKDEETPRFTE